MNKKHYIYLTVLIAMLSAACSKDDGDSAQQAGGEAQEIRVNADVWRVMEGTRATTIDTDGALQTTGFKTYVYVDGSTTKYINGSTVSYADSKWEFDDGKHYWPAEGNLDFFAYMPATKPSYITEPTYSVSGTPQASFTCSDLPMTYNATSPEAGQGSSLQEFIWGITVGQNKTNQGVSGVTMKLRHPFARIKFQLAANHPDIQINSITFKSLKTGGTCTLNNTAIADTYYYTTSAWSSLTGNSDLVMTLANKVDDGKGNMVWDPASVNTFNSNPVSEVVPIGGWAESAHQYVNLLVIPQEFAGAIEINASWNDWGDTPVEHTVTTTIPSITWQAGYSYTYTFTITPEDLVVNLTDFTEQW